MHGLGALATGFTKATASLDTCHTTNRALRGQKANHGGEAWGHAERATDF